MTNRQWIRNMQSSKCDLPFEFPASRSATKIMSLGGHQADTSAKNWCEPPEIRVFNYGQVSSSKKYRSKPCFQFHKSMYCSLGESCQFYHNDRDDEMMSTKMQSGDAGYQAMLENPDLRTTKIAFDLEKLIVKATLMDQGTGRILQEIKDSLLPSRSRFGFLYQAEECTKHLLEDNLTILWRQSEKLLQQLLIFTHENGPLPTENLQTLLRLVVVSLHAPTPLYPAEATLSKASKYLRLLLINHKLRSKRPFAPRPEGDPMDALRSFLFTC